MREFKENFVRADLQRLQAPKRDETTYGSCRGSHNAWPKRDADEDSDTLLEQEQVLSILERRHRGTEVSPGRETREQPRAHVERVGISHDIYGLRGLVVDACIGRTKSRPQISRWLRYGSHD